MVSSIFTDNSVHCYMKGNEKTAALIPTHKSVLGKGVFGQAHIAKNDPSLVVKKSTHSLVHEYDVGVELDHPNIVKVHKLFIKYYPGKKPAKYKLVMDKIEGQHLKQYYGKKLPADVVRSLLLQLQDCCLYLLKQKMKWGDLHGENLYFNEGENKLIIADFGQWGKETSLPKLAYRLLSQARRAMFNILSISSIQGAHVSDTSKLDFSLDIYGHDGKPSQALFEIVKNNKLSKDYFEEKSLSQIKTIFEKYFAKVNQRFTDAL